MLHYNSNRFFWNVALDQLTILNEHQQFGIFEGNDAAYFFTIELNGTSVYDR